MLHYLRFPEGEKEENTALFSSVSLLTELNYCKTDLVLSLASTEQKSAHLFLASIQGDIKLPCVISHFKQ
jgi:hypothetical protein